MVSSFRVLRDNPVNRQRAPGAGNRSHSGFVSTTGDAVGREARVLIGFESCAIHRVRAPALFNVRPLPKTG